MSWTVALAAVIAGLMVGMTGIGGVVLVPALTEFAHMPVDRAIATTLFGFVLSGGASVYIHLRRARLDAVPVLMVCGAAAIGALAGAVTLGWLPGQLVRLFIALLCIASGLHALLPKPAEQGPLPSNGVLAALGLVIGYASAISGTGGPVTLIPVLLALNTHVATAIALGVAVQVPIILTATAVNALEARIDYAAGIAIGVLIVAGTYAGAWVGARLSTQGLKLAVSLTLIVVGGWYAYATLWRAP